MASNLRRLTLRRKIQLIDERAITIVVAPFARSRAPNKPWR
jgi:hypothetical protein